MKQLLLLFICLSCFGLQAQTNKELIKHYEDYYKQMKSQGDVQGIINGLTHLNILNPSQARKDTLAFVYMGEGKYIQALNTIGAGKASSDSNLAIQVKAFSLKELGQMELALEQFDALFSRTPNATIALELAEINLQLNKLAEAKKHTDYGISNSGSDDKKAFYETQRPYQVSLKSAFLHLKALIIFNENKVANLDQAISLLDDLLRQEPSFNMAKLSKEALQTLKTKN